MPRQMGFLPAGFVTLLLVVLGCSRQPSGEPAPRLELTADSSPNMPAEPFQEPLQEATAVEETSAPGKLDVGALAPQIEIAHWVQGEQVDRFEPGHTYVVEFWATWCGPCRDGMPHIAQLQQHYQGQVTFIGVTGENEATVSSFLGKAQNAETGETWGDVVTYALALDSGRATSAAYMQAAGRSGIPCAFIVGPDGHIEWIGHPAAIDEPLEQIVAGTWNRTEYLARRRAEQEKELAMRRAIATLQKAQQEGDWATAIGAMDDLIEQNPEQPAMKTLKLSLLLRAQQYQDAENLAEQIAEENWESPDPLNAIAWTLATQRQDSSQSLPIALRLAKRANELHDGQDASTHDTLARIYYEQGNLDEAIASQEKAVELGPEIEGIEATLKRYLIERDGDVGSSETKRSEPAEPETDVAGSTDPAAESEESAEPDFDVVDEEPN